MIKREVRIGNKIRQHQPALIGDVPTYIFKQCLLVPDMVGHFQAENEIVITGEGIFGAVAVEYGDAVLQLTLDYFGSGQRCLFVGDVVSMKPEMLMLLRESDQV